MRNMEFRAAELLKLPQGSGRQSTATLLKIEGTASHLASILTNLKGIVAQQKGLRAARGSSGNGEVLMVQTPAIRSADSDARQAALFLSAPDTITFLKTNPDVIPEPLKEPETWSRHTSCIEAKKTKLSKEVRRSGT